jgi:hypothetical protein
MNLNFVFPKQESERASDKIVVSKTAAIAIFSKATGANLSYAKFWMECNFVDPAEVRAVDLGQMIAAYMKKTGVPYDQTAQ